jgi:phenylalanyl-tRNA synthetase alpha chain
VSADAGARARITEAVEEALAAVAAARTTDDLQRARTGALGRKAAMSEMRSGMGALSPDERKDIGLALNDARERIESAIAARESELASAERAAALAADRVDVTLPGRGVRPGHPHPISLVIDRVTDLFVGMGYRVAEGPEVETDWYNFEALNIPAHHPARSTQDSMFVADTDLLLRTQTSPVQIRAMQAQDPPIYVIAPGRVYRRDPFDASHSPMFYQIEGLAIDRGISMADLRGTLAAFAREMFGPEQKVRMRPSYFPFTEPSAEVDVLCVRCGGDGCAACKGTGWMEILGCGMVHPNVLKTAGYDPQEWSGFAFGMGPERIAMLAYGIADIRLLYENDQRFLAGFTG